MISDSLLRREHVSPRVLEALPKDPELRGSVQLLRSLLANSKRVDMELPELG